MSRNPHDAELPLATAIAQEVLGRVLEHRDYTPVELASWVEDAIIARVPPSRPEPIQAPPTAAEVLRRAADLIEQRAVQRDREDGEKSAGATAEAFNAIHSEAVRANGGRLTDVHIWHVLELVKMRRAAYGVYVPDDYEDKTAYAALAAEAAAAAHHEQQQ